MSSINNSVCADYPQGTVFCGLTEARFCRVLRRVCGPVCCFMRERRACLLGLPFLREIFMELPLLCHASDVTADYFSSCKKDQNEQPVKSFTTVAFTATCNISGTGKKKTSWKMPRVSMAWHYKLLANTLKFESIPKQVCCCQTLLCANPPPPKTGPH